MGSGVSFGDLFGWAMFAIIGIFALSCIELFAQARQVTAHAHIHTRAHGERNAHSKRRVVPRRWACCT